MKNFKRFIAVVIFPALFVATGIITSSCSKSDAEKTPDPVYACLSCHTTPDALVANDASIKGVYKGVVVGSTGTLSINIQNGNNTITATMVLDGVTVLLTSSVAVVDGMTYVAPFTGTMNGAVVSITFQVGAGGVGPMMVSSNIPGHPNATFNLYKETSTSLIEAFEGTYTHAGDTGTFNIILSSGLAKWGYTAKDNASGEINSGQGTTNGAQLHNEEGLLVATISGDTLQGTSTDSSGSTVTVNGHRTL